MLPSPSWLLAAPASDAPVPPDSSGKGVIPEIDPPVIATAPALCTDIDPNPKLVLASDAVPAPVPPEVNGRESMPVIVPPHIAT